MEGKATPQRGTRQARPSLLAAMEALTGGRDSPPTRRASHTSVGSTGSSGSHGRARSKWAMLRESFVTTGAEGGTAPKEMSGFSRR